VQVASAVARAASLLVGGPLDPTALVVRSVSLSASISPAGRARHRGFDLVASHSATEQTSGLAVVSGSRIVLAEDDRGIRELLRNVLREAGYTVLSVDNGAAALDAVIHAPPSLLITDVRMPLMDGWTLILHVRQHGLSLPILVLTGDPDDPLALQVNGVDAYVEKPFDWDSFLDVVHRLVTEP
jgi:CheY-like chemotaxis protein